MFQAEVRLKAELQRDPPTIHWSACKRAAEFGHEHAGLPASSVGRRVHRALNFLFSWDNQSLVFPPTTLFTRDQESAEAKMSECGVGNLRLGYYRKTGGQPGLLFSL